jgi:hypothetical protein
MASFMKNKTFYRTSIDSLLLQIIVVIGLFLDVVACVISTYAIVAIWSVKEYPIAIFGMIFFYLGIPLLIYIELTFVIGSIQINQEGIKNKGDIRLPKEKIQYPVFVSFENIASIEIVAYRNASNGKRITLSRPIPYLFVHTMDKKTARFALHFMSKTCVKNLLEYLLDGCALHNNNLAADIDSLIESFSLARIKTK